MALHPKSRAWFRQQVERRLSDPSDPFMSAERVRDVPGYDRLSRTECAIIGQARLLRSAGRRGDEARKRWTEGR